VSGLGLLVDIHCSGILATIGFLNSPHPKTCIQGARHFPCCNVERL